MGDLTREEAKALRAELADLLGYYPAGLAPESIARCRIKAAERLAEALNRTHRRGFFVFIYHLKEEKRRREVEVRGRAAASDLYE